MTEAVFSDASFYILAAYAFAGLTGGILTVCTLKADRRARDELSNLKRCLKNLPDKAEASPPTHHLSYPAGQTPDKSKVAL